MTHRIKSFDDLTDEEVLALTPEQVDRYIDLECAINGVPLLPPEEPVKPEPFQKTKDVEVFKVGDLAFATMEQALTVASVVNATPRLSLEYANSGSYDYEQVARPAEGDVHIQTERHYSPHGWQRDKEAVQSAARLQKEYERAMKEFKDAVEKREEASRSIRARIEEVHELHYKRERLRSEFRRYVNLAGGDETIAANFLRNAHYEAVHLLPELYDLPTGDAEEAVSVMAGGDEEAF